MIHKIELGGGNFIEFDVEGQAIGLNSNLHEVDGGDWNIAVDTFECVLLVLATVMPVNSLAFHEVVKVSFESIVNHLS